ncbi:MAG: hypothetical protein H0Z32_03765 [Bacillaceae bacterium]|nr:hypothetical protein [Bacillaceae bacterium]
MGKLFILLPSILLFLTGIPVTGHAQKIVETDTVYTYEMMQEDLRFLDQEYGDLIEVFETGKTPYGRHLYLVKLGYGDAHVFYNASHHAREWLTTILLMNMLEEYAKAYQTGSDIQGYNLKELLHQTTIWMMPMVNPDGVTLQQKGLSAFPKSVHQQLIQFNEGSRDFKRWKANAEGIDLNRQYPAGWEEIEATRPSWKNYKGTRPFQAKEVQTVRDLTYILDPQITLAYHTAGQIIYWNYNIEPKFIERDTRIAETYSRMSGYRLVETRTGSGYTDWFNVQFKRPGLTPELGVYPGERNVDPTYFPEAWKRNQLAALYMAEEGFQLSEKISNPRKEGNDVIYADGRFERDILPSDAMSLYQQILYIKRNYSLHIEQAVKLYSWYKGCEGKCSMNDPVLSAIFPPLKKFQQWETKRTVNAFHTWKIKMNIPIDSNSVHGENIYILDSQLNRVDIQIVPLIDEIAIKPPKGGYKPGTYTLYIKEVRSRKNAVMKTPVEMQFRVE